MIDSLSPVVNKHLYNKGDLLTTIYSLENTASQVLSLQLVTTSLGLVSINIEFVD